MTKFFRTEDGFVLWFDGVCRWTDGDLSFLHSTQTNGPVNSKNQPLPGEFIETRTGDELLNAIHECLAEADTDVVLRVANSVLSGTHVFLRTLGDKDIYEVVQNTEAVDDLCDRLNGDVLLLITLDNSMGGASSTTWNVAALGKDIEGMGGIVTDIDALEELARRWCELRGYSFLRVEVLDRRTLAN